ncbi:MAG: LytTR family transcriptional regulator, partial [Ekhidna sp.]|nr:LytTR family transcriptional regulator [Ekhidna sp.]
MTRKVLSEACITLLISVIIYFLVDFKIIFFSEWDTDKIVNILHTWLTLLTAYYLYNWLLILAFQRWVIDRLSKWISLLSTTTLLVFAYVILTDIAFYKLYYGVTSLYDETTFFEFDLPITLVVLIVGSFYFYQRYYHKSIEAGSHSELEPKQIKVQKGKSTHLIDIDTILLIYSKQGLVWLQNTAQEKFTINYTLDGISSELNPNQFFRLNRQTIVSRKSIKGFQKLDYQKLDSAVH